VSPQRSPSGIAYDRGGPNGRIPIVLVHAGVADRGMWDPQWPALTAARDIVRVDLRGFGESTTKPVGPLTHVTDVIDTLEHLGIERCHLVGCSLGAGVGTEVALKRPDLVQSLLLCPPGGSLLVERTPDLVRFFEAENAALARGDLDAAVRANTSTWVVGLGRDESEVDPAVVAAVGEMQRNVFEIGTAWGDVEETDSGPPALEQLTAPVLVLVGGHDLDTTHDAAWRVCAAVERVERVDWAGTAHLPSMERPAPFTTLLLDWVASYDQPTDV
jgi:3-oxoadipate enol-lactonase